MSQREEGKKEKEKRERKKKKTRYKRRNEEEITLGGINMPTPQNYDCRLMEKVKKKKIKNNQKVTNNRRNHSPEGLGGRTWKRKDGQCFFLMPRVTMMSH